LYFQRLDGTEEAITLAASEVKAERGTTGGTSTTRVTVITPTSGKKIRVISLTMYSASSTVANFEVYFDTGANFASDTTKGIAIMRLKDTDERKFALSWPDGGGPIGAVDDVLSLRTSVDIAGNGVIMVHYREE
jgi:prolyl-tRNA synthetase